MKIHYYTEEIIKICDCQHLTVEDIYDKISKKYPEAGKSSIYRNVEELVNKGDLVKVIGVGKKAYFEKNKGSHFHLIDKNTGEIMDMDHCFVLPNLPENFKISEVDLKVFGEFVSA
ncbi:MAG: transcriptional repressor [Candidatus Gracilibacteria bacterium]|nr:transcriptional repressor [Candidatus Gracilibacteria bacterium]